MIFFSTCREAFLQQRVQGQQRVRHQDGQHFKSGGVFQISVISLGAFPWMSQEREEKRNASMLSTLFMIRLGLEKMREAFQFSGFGNNVYKECV